MILQSHTYHHVQGQRMGKVQDWSSSAANNDGAYVSD